MSRDETIRKKVLKLLQEKPKTDSFEISVIIRESVDDINRTLEKISSEDGTVLLFPP